MLDICSHVIANLNAPGHITTYVGPNNACFAVLAAHCPHLRKVVLDGWTPAQSADCLQRLLAPECPLLEDIEFGDYAALGAASGLFAKVLNRHSASLVRLALARPVDFFESIRGQSFVPLASLREIRLVGIEGGNPIEDEETLLVWARSWVCSELLWKAHLDVLFSSTGSYLLAKAVSSVRHLEIPPFELPSDVTEPIHFGCVVFSILGWTAASISAVATFSSSIQSICIPFQRESTETVESWTFHNLKVLIFGHELPWTPATSRFISLSADTLRYVEIESFEEDSGT